MPDIRKLRESEAAYIAGIIDGEGTITLTRTHRGENRRPIVSVSSTERALLQYLRLVIGAGRTTNKRRSRTHHSASFAYVISSRNALALLSQISQYLHTYKLRRANLLLREYLRVTPRNGRYFPSLKLARSAFERDFLAITTRAPNVPVHRPHSADCDRRQRQPGHDGLRHVFVSEDRSGLTTTPASGRHVLRVR